MHGVTEKYIYVMRIYETPYEKHLPCDSVAMFERWQARSRISAILFNDYLESRVMNRSRMQTIVAILKLQLLVRQNKP